MADPIANFQSSPFNGPFSENALIFDALAAAPFEGLWIPTAGLKNLSLDVEGTFSALSMQLYGTNLDSVGTVNKYVLTVSGTITNADVISTTFKNSNIPTGSEVVMYTVQSADTTSTIATALAAAINADPILGPMGFSAIAAAAVVTVSFPSVPANVPASTPGTPAPANTTNITTSVSGSATEVVTTTCGSNGNTIGSAITAVGLTAITTIPKYVKARLTSMTGSILNAALQGAG